MSSFSVPWPPGSERDPRRFFRHPVSWDVARRPWEAWAHPTFYGPRGATHNDVYDWDKLQGVHNGTDLHHQIPRDVNVRHVTIENSSAVPVGVAITTYAAGPTPAVDWVSAPGDTRHVGINSQGGDPQWMWLLNPDTGALLGRPQLLDRMSNQFVIRYGINNVFVQRFTRGSYHAA